ncbi:hypothetical protein QQF64_020540 [Cirrhinus molitorella]|uniref:Uncharacterized protein n=1 Tax=Cirrhinus molitorella TaxID=172907 RepID=A0ABR3LAY3_9TELE
MIQSDREKLSSKQQRPRELPRRSNRERKPHRRYETESRPPPHSPRRTERGHKRYEERVDRDNPNFHNSERKRFRNLPRNRVHRSDNDKEKSGYVSPEKWNKLTTEERARIMAEREKGRSNSGADISVIKDSEPHGRLVNKVTVEDFEGNVRDKERQYKINSEAEEEIAITIKELTEQGVLRKLGKNESALSNAPIQAVLKPGMPKSWRLVTNFKALNKVTVPDTRYLINCSEACGDIDDILMASETQEEHFKLLEQTLDRITEAGLKPSLKKMEIGKHQIDFLGFKLGKDSKALTTSTRSKLEEMEKSGELERRDDTVPLHVSVSEEGDEVTLTVANEGGKVPISFLTHQQETTLLKFEDNSPERILAAVTKRLLQLKAVAKEQPIVIYSHAGELHRIKSNLVMNQARIHSQRWDQWSLILGDNQLEWRKIRQKRKEKMTKYHDAHLHLPKYFTDGSEKAGKVKWGFLFKKDGQLITSQSGEIAGTAQLAEVTAVEKGN